MELVVSHQVRGGRQQTQAVWTSVRVQFPLRVVGRASGTAIHAAIECKYHQRTNTTDCPENSKVVTDTQASDWNKCRQSE